ncbi:hypothetical protein PRIC2_009145 [Phytophthora ramorum]
MAFLEDDDAVRAFEAALSFVEQYSIDTSVFTASPSGFSPAEDIELLSPSLTPAFSAHMASPGAASDTSTASPSSPVFQLSNATTARLERGPQAAGQVSAHRKASARGRKKTAGPKKPVTRGDPNRARNERKIELAFLREKIKMARGLESLLQKRAKQQVVECSSLSQTNKSKYSQGRTLDFRADVNDFKDLLAHLDRAYRELTTASRQLRL